MELVTFLPVVIITKLYHFAPKEVAHSVERATPGPGFDPRFRAPAPYWLSLCQYKSWRGST